MVNFCNQEKIFYIQVFEFQLEVLEKGGYEYFMLKEIYEQLCFIEDCFCGRLNVIEGWVLLGGIKDYE